MKQLRFAKIRDVKSPEYGTQGSAGIDFFVPNFEKSFILHAHSDVLIPSGLIVSMPENHMLMGADKSGIATSKWACIGAGKKPKVDSFDSAVIIGAKIIDSDYQGELWIHLINTGSARLEIKPGMKIAQFILVPIVHAELEEVLPNEVFNTSTERGTGGFGSTNK